MRIAIGEIDKYLENYYTVKNSEIESNITCSVCACRQEQCLNEETFRQICHWKSPRSKRWYDLAESDCIVKQTKLAFGDNIECELRFKSLRKLRGVGVPVASALLQWWFPNAFPIIDFRCLWTLEIDIKPPYKMDMYQLYQQKCVDVAETYTNECKKDISLQKLDRALWQFSKERQPKKKPDGGCL